mmetsp:Transcript_1890/g.4464  ORF Transcript_1890/g.4464 Transcript_1890/m.4464 type:complete len:217 (+) Transcript_1890:1253-1903(+)
MRHSQCPQSNSTTLLQRGGVVDSTPSTRASAPSAEASTFSFSGLPPPASACAGWSPIGSSSSLSSPSCTPPNAPIEATASSAATTPFSTYAASPRAAASSLASISSCPVASPAASARSSSSRAAKHAASASASFTSASSSSASAGAASALFKGSPRVSADSILSAATWNASIASSLWRMLPGSTACMPVLGLQSACVVHSLKACQERRKAAAPPSA